MQLFSKRKPKSNWSKINKEKVQQLTDSGRMTAAGYESVATAKQNGSWTILDTVEALSRMIWKQHSATTKTQRRIF